MAQEAWGKAEWGSEGVSCQCTNQLSSRKNLGLTAAIQSVYLASQRSGIGVNSWGSRGVNGGINGGRRAGSAIPAALRLEGFNRNHIMYMRAGGYAYLVYDRACSLDDLVHRASWRELVGAL